MAHVMSSAKSLLCRKQNIPDVDLQITQLNTMNKLKAYVCVDFRETGIKVHCKNKGQYIGFMMSYVGYSKNRH